MVIITRENKIVKHNIQSFVNPLLEDGYSDEKIAKIIQVEFGDEIKDLRNISHMSVYRYRESKADNQIIELQQTGVNVTELLVQDLLKKTTDIIKDIEEITDKTKKLYKQAEEENASFSDKVRILKELREGIGQKVSTLESRINYGTRRIETANTQGERKAQNLNVLIIQMADDLCDNCKRKILEKLKNSTK